MILLQKKILQVPIEITFFHFIHEKWKFLAIFLLFIFQFLCWPWLWSLILISYASFSKQNKIYSTKKSDQLLYCKHFSSGINKKQNFCVVELSLLCYSFSPTFSLNIFISNNAILIQLAPIFQEQLKRMQYIWLEKHVRCSITNNLQYFCSAIFYRCLSTFHFSQIKAFWSSLTQKFATLFLKMRNPKTKILKYDWGFIWPKIRKRADFVVVEKPSYFLILVKILACFSYSYKNI